MGRDGGENMQANSLKIGFGLTGSHCTIPDIWDALKKIVAEGIEVFPIISQSVCATDTRFGKAAEIINKLQEVTGHFPWTSMVEVEPIGPRQLLDVMVVAPCTGTTLAKLALGISDTPVTLACKAQLRNKRPVVLALATNDALGANFTNIGVLMARKNLYFVPFNQDNPVDKEYSMVSRLDFLPQTINAALQGDQLQPVIL